MAAPANPKLAFVRGDDETVLLYIDSDALSTPVNITGRSYVMSIGVPGSTPITSNAGAVTGASGLVTFDFTAAQTATLVGSGYSYDVSQTSSGAVSTLIIAALTVATRVAA